MLRIQVPFSGTPANQGPYFSLDNDYDGFYRFSKIDDFVKQIEHFETKIITTDKA